MLAPVLYRDDRLLVVHKPAGIHVHRSAYDRHEPSLAEGLEHELGQTLFPVHRLDRPTAGVLVFALDREAASVLGAAFRDRRVDKEYRAVVRGWMPAAHVTAAVNLDVKDPRTTDAETNFRPLELYEAPWPRRGFDTFRFSLVEALPITGRRHQIRQHCDHQRHPILGDTVWGDTKLNAWFASQLDPTWPPAGLHLWCRRLEVPHPDGGRRAFEAPWTPDDAQRLSFYRLWQRPMESSLAFPSESRY